jgi:CheY-like chemotaxis protein
VSAYERVDLLISDIGMPEMDGHKLAERMLEMRPDTFFPYGFARSLARTAAGVIECSVQQVSRLAEPEPIPLRARAFLALKSKRRIFGKLGCLGRGYGIP